MGPPHSGGPIPALRSLEQGPALSAHYWPSSACAPFRKEAKQELQGMSSGSIFIFSDEEIEASGRYFTQRLTVSKEG